MLFRIDGYSRNELHSLADISYHARCVETEKDYLITFPEGMEKAMIRRNATTSGQQATLENVRFKALELIGDAGGLPDEMLLTTGNHITIAFSDQFMISEFIKNENENIKEFNK